LGGNINLANTPIHAVCRPQALNRGVRPGDKTGAGNSQPVMAEDFEPLDITPDFYRCELGSFESGSYNVSVLLPPGLAWNNPVDTGLFSHDASGKKYQVQYFPNVAQLWPDSGSHEGGTTVTIRGQGFSMDEEDIVVLLGGVRCEVSLVACGG
jgi:hypothetical protein